MKPHSTLTQIMNANRSDKGTLKGAGHSYTLVYEQWFESIRQEPLRVLEIGVCDPRRPGASLQSWHEYFPNATLYGYDIEDAHRFDNDRIVTFIGDQSNPADLARFIEFSGGEFDLIIDDGSHLSRHQQASLAFLFPYLKPGGQYIIEDLHCSPNTLGMLCRMHPGLPGEWPDRTFGKRVRAFYATLLWVSVNTVLRALLKGVFRGSRVRFWSTYISSQEIDEIRGGTERLDLICDARLARLTKRSNQGLERSR
jgi:hypothetical protein